jgi:hypothetical protein
MMGRLNHDQGRLFYSFCLEEAVPDDHLVRGVAAVLDLSWVHAELTPHYPDNGRPSIDPELTPSAAASRVRVTSWLPRTQPSWPGFGRGYCSAATLTPPVTRRCGWRVHQQR